MKKRIMFLIGVVFAGIIAYYGGYELYRINRPKVEIPDRISMQYSAGSAEQNTKDIGENYYFGIIEQEYLNIYELPEQQLYDSIRLNSLHLQEEEVSQLIEGQHFYSLTEVFEFLENSMS